MSHVLDKGKNRNKQIWSTFLAFTEDLVLNVNLLKVTEIKQLTALTLFTREYSELLATLR